VRVGIYLTCLRKETVTFERGPSRKKKKKQTVWFLPGSNRRPCPCEGHVITTTLRNLAGREANSLFEILSGSKCGMDLSQQCTTGSRGATDNASDYGSEDCRFESCRDRIFIFEQTKCV
jgi:hypothetical protein